jgi:hypothetical protein
MISSPHLAVIFCGWPLYTVQVDMVSCGFWRKKIDERGKGKDRDKEERIEKIKKRRM